MAFEAQRYRGDPRGRMDYTPSSGAVAAGQVVVLGGAAGLSCGIATQDIANNTPGSLDIGGGTYLVTMLGNYAPYSAIWWDDANNKVTTTSTSNAKFGYLLTGNTGANTIVEAVHDPDQ